MFTDKQASPQLHKRKKEGSAWSRRRNNSPVPRTQQNTLHLHRTLNRFRLQLLASPIYQPPPHPQLCSPKTQQICHLFKHSEMEICHRRDFWWWHH